LDQYTENIGFLKEMVHKSTDALPQVCRDYGSAKPKTGYLKSVYKAKPMSCSKGKYKF